MKLKKLILGTRGSKLALVQANTVADLLRASGAHVELKIMKTTADRIPGSLAEVGGKGLFVKELEEGLLTKSIDLAVHSLKDVPGFLPEGLVIASVLKREDPRDVLISRGSKKLHELPQGARIGTSGPRRKFQLLKLRPDLEILPIRGNVETRIKKMEAGEFDAIILAAAGLNRLGMHDVVTEYFSTEQMSPAVGQGIVAIETRVEDKALIEFLRKNLNHPETWIALEAERALLQTINGDCFTPVAAHAVVEKNNVQLSAFLAGPEGKPVVTNQDSSFTADANTIGGRLGKSLLQALSVKDAR
ncbi:MAG: hydroxymethylbilane synthase [Deltaproteobacteria bacterium]|nr:hydroxymethylbilane synthase [Deltaproteobacteria bacterium]